MQNLGVPNANLCTNFDVKSGLRVHEPQYRVTHSVTGKSHLLRHTESDKGPYWQCNLGLHYMLLYPNSYCNLRVMNLLFHISFIIVVPTTLVICNTK